MSDLTLDDLDMEIDLLHKRVDELTKALVHLGRELGQHDFSDGLIDYHNTFANKIKQLRAKTNE